MNAEILIALAKAQFYDRVTEAARNRVPRR